MANSGRKEIETAKHIKVHTKAGVVDMPDVDEYSCLVGDTKILLLDGRDIPIRELVGEQFYVYSYDFYTNRIVPGRAHSCRVTRKNVPVVEVELDNGKTIRCTKDHRFLLRNSRYKEAGCLEPGDSLMPLYHRADERGYLEVHHPTGSWEKIHSIVYLWKYGKDIVDNLPVPHHKDFNKMNNSPENFVGMGNVPHFVYHSRNASKLNMLVWNHPMYHDARAKRIASMRESTQRRIEDGTHQALGENNKFKKRIEADPEFREKFSKKCSRANRKRVDSGTHNFITSNPSKDPRVRKILSEKMKALSAHRAKEELLWHSSFADPAIQLKAGKGRILNVMVEALHEKGKVDEETYNHIRKTKHSGRGVNWENIPRYLGSIDVAIQQTYERVFDKVQNHKVHSVKNVGKSDVYDFEVDKYHNFAISAGVFLHNCGFRYLHVRLLEAKDSVAIKRSVITKVEREVNGQWIPVNLKKKVIV